MVEIAGGIILAVLILAGALGLLSLLVFTSKGWAILRFVGGAAIGYGVWLVGVFVFLILFPDLHGFGDRPWGSEIFVGSLAVLALGMGYAMAKK